MPDNYQDIVNPFEQYLTYIILSLTIFLNASYIFFRSQKLKLTKKKAVVLFTSAFVLSVVRAFLINVNNISSLLVLELGIALILTLLGGKDKNVGLTVSFVSISIMHMSNLIANFIYALITWFINTYIIKSFVIHFWEYIFIGIINFGLVLLYFKIRRFRNGIQFFQKSENMGLGLIIASIVFMIACTHNGSDIFPHLGGVVIMFTIFIASVGMYLWIRRSITANYRSKLQQKAEEHFNAVLAEKDDYIDRLLKSNESLAKIVHRDNHLMNSLEFAIADYNETRDETQKEVILGELLTLAKERGELVCSEQRSSKILPSVGNNVIDGALNSLYVKATAHGIDFDVNASQSVSYLINDFISQTDLETLLCDHIKDAIIAIDADKSIRGKIFVSFSLHKGVYTITISDNGIEFEPETLAKLGLERATTHAEDGGSGIGFMTTFETLKKTGASLTITEYKNKVPFTKSISFVFNGKNRFEICSYRKQILEKTIRRKDLKIKDCNQ